jgi:polyhydroxyalkanoate synthesis regulator phasin
MQITERFRKLRAVRDAIDDLVRDGTLWHGHGEDAMRAIEEELDAVARDWAEQTGRDMEELLEGAPEVRVWS